MASIGDDPGSGGSGKTPQGGDPLSKRRPTNAMLIFLVIVVLAVILIAMGQHLTGGSKTKDVSWGTMAGYLESEYQILTEKRLQELRAGLDGIEGLSTDARASLVGIIGGIPDTDTNLRGQDRALRRMLKGVAGLTPEQRTTALGVIDQVMVAAREDLKQARAIKKITVEGDTITAELNVEHQVKVPGATEAKSYRIIRAKMPARLAESPELEQRLLAAVADPGDVEYKRPWPVWEMLLTVLPWIFIFLLIYFFFFRTMRSAGGPGSVLNFSKSRARLITGEQVKVTFDDVAGVDEAKEEVHEIVEFLKTPRKFRRLGGRTPRGILLVGPPGTGKTLLAKAISGESGVPFFSISGSDFVEMFVGVGAGRVRDLFRQAREQSPCVIFLDEIDAVGRRRGSGLGGGHDEREQTLNQILVEMDGFTTDENVIVMAATNRPDILDPALLRPGRFDREVVLDLPDVGGREAILKVHIKKIRLQADVDLKILARGTPGCSGADLAAIINEAAIIATMRSREEVTGADLEEARDKTMWGRQKKSRVMNDEEKRVTAFHEAGHAVVAQLLHPVSEPVHKVTIIPRGMSLGSTMRLPERDRYIMPKSYFKAQLAVLFGGRAAEEIFFDDVSHGARDDIKKATDIARAMVTEFGMSEEMGPVAYGDPQEHLFLGREITKTSHHSEATAQMIDAEVKRLLMEGYNQAKDLITRNREKLEKIGAALLKYETLTGDEVGRVLQGEDIDSIRANAPAQTA